VFNNKLEGCRGLVINIVDWEWS